MDTEKSKIEIQRLVKASFRLLAEGNRFSKCRITVSPWYQFNPGSVSVDLEKPTDDKFSTIEARGFYWDIKLRLRQFIETSSAPEQLARSVNDHIMRNCKFSCYDRLMIRLDALDKRSGSWTQITD